MSSANGSINATLRLENYTMRRSEYEKQAELCKNGVNPVVNPFPATYVPGIFVNQTPHSWPPREVPAQCMLPGNMHVQQYLKQRAQCPNIAGHDMHAEFFEISLEEIKAISAMAML